MSSPKNKLTLQQQIAELDTLLEWFDQPDIDVDQALEKFEDGVKLAEEIKTRVAALENSVTKLKQRFDRE